MDCQPVFLGQKEVPVSQEKYDAAVSSIPVHHVLMCKLCLQDEEGKSRGFGFVNFEDSDGAHAAVSALNGKDFSGKELFCGRAQKKSEREAELKAK